MNSKLREIIRRIVKEEIDSAIDEVSTSGGVAGFQSPYAFSSKKKKSPENPFTKETDRMEGGKKKEHQPVPFGEGKVKLRKEDWDKKAKARAETVGNDIMTGDLDHDKNNSIDDRSKKDDFESPTEGQTIRRLEGKKDLPGGQKVDQDDSDAIEKKSRWDVATLGGEDFPKTGTQKAGRIQNSVPYRKGGPYWEYNVSQTDDVFGKDQKKGEEEADDNEAKWAEETRIGNNTGFGRNHLGYDAATPTKESKKKFEETGEEIPKTQYVKSAMHEGRSRYHQFKEEAGTPRAKIGKALTEMHRQLGEVERIVEMSRRLKTETQVGSGDMWKRANKALVRMEDRLVSLSSKLKELRS